MKDLLATIELYDDDTPGMAYGGRAGFSNGGINILKAEEEAFNRALKAFDYYKSTGGKKNFRDYLRQAGERGDQFRAEGGRIGFKKGERADLELENLTRMQNAKEKGVRTKNASGFKALPGYDNITYTDFRNKETGEVFRKYGVRVRVQDKNVQKIGTTADKYKNIDSLDEALKLRDDFRKANPKNIKPLDPEKAKITKGARRDFIKTQGGVEDFLTGDKGSGVQKGHAGNIENPDLKIKPSNIIYTPTEINEAMAAKLGAKGTKETFSALDFKIRAAENEIKKIKRSKKSLAEKKRLLNIQDKLLTDYHFQSGGFKTPTLSDGTVFGESTRKAMSMDQMDFFPDMTEKETRNFVRQYITEKGTLKPFYQRKVNAAKIEAKKRGVPLNDILNEFIDFKDIENIQKSKLFLENVESAKQNVKKFDVAAMKRLAAIGCPGKAMGGRIGFFEGQNLNECAFKGIQRLQTTDVKKLTPGDKANVKAITKTVQGGRLLKNVLGPGALAFEGLFAAPFAAYDFARGRPGMDTLKSALSLGFLDQKLTDAELKKIYPEYGAAENLKNIGDRLTNLERLQKGTRGQRIRSRGKTKIAEDQFKKALQPFLDTGDPEKAYRENIQKSKDAEKELDRQYKERAKDRTTQFDLSDPFAAAGGGIAKEAGDPSGAMLESMNPDSQGLPSLLKRVRNL